MLRFYAVVCKRKPVSGKSFFCQREFRSWRLGVAVDVVKERRMPYIMECLHVSLPFNLSTSRTQSVQLSYQVVIKNVISGSHLTIRPIVDSDPSACTGSISQYLSVHQCSVLGKFFEPQTYHFKADALTPSCFDASFSGSEKYSSMRFKESTTGGNGRSSLDLGTMCTCFNFPCMGRTTMSSGFSELKSGRMRPSAKKVVK